MGTPMRTCRLCGCEKAETDFRKLTARAGGGYSGICKACEAAKRAQTRRKAHSNSNPLLVQFTPRDLIEELKIRGYKGVLTIERKIQL